MKWEPNTNYSKEDLKAMQQDAIQRVQEMRRRADHALRGGQPTPSFSSGRGSSPRPSSSYPHQGSYPPLSHPAGDGTARATPPPPTAPTPGPILQSSVSGAAAQGRTAQGQTAQGQSAQGQSAQGQSAQGQGSPGPSPAGPAQSGAGRGLLGNLANGLGEGVEQLVTALSGSSNPQQRDTLGKVLEALNLDGERILLLALMLLLYNDGADYALLLAMIYLLI